MSSLLAQHPGRLFQTYLFNDELQVFLRINLYDEDVNIPGQEIYGPLPGYLSGNKSSFCWLITSSEIIDSTTARLTLINDYGSEDLSVRLKQTSDSTYEWKHLNGSPLKMPDGKKWKKLPGSFVLKRK